MPLHPHLHLLIPSSSGGVPLEARLYLPRDAGLTTVTTSRSEPTALADLMHTQRAALRALGIRRVVTAAHPWGRLGGNMLFPVLAAHIPAGIFGSPGRPGPGAADTAYVTFNVRGIGRSGGSMPWPGWGIGHDAADFAAVEGAVLALVGEEGKSADGVGVYRIGYSYGTNLALHAPTTHPVERTLLISPAPTLFKGLTIFKGPTFAAGLSAALDRAAEARAKGDARTLWHVFGSKDDFTSEDTLRALGGDRQEEITAVEIEGCGHFFAREEDGLALQKTVAEWLGR